MVTPSQPSCRFLGPGDKLGKYELIRQIAVGGMAELYLARTVGIEGFEKLACVKRILPQYIDNPSFVTMFLNEARLAATLHHPNIAQVYDIGQEGGEFFFSMEYVHGEDLGRLVVAGRENGVPISLDCALTLAAGLCAGLHHAHEKAGPDGRPLGVVHRDVSPTNVLVSYDGAVKLVDFGIARAGGEPSQSGTGLKGKISYMSPEQCRGRGALDRRSDVFSVGTLLYELTTGRMPFVAETEYAVLNQIVTRDAEPPSAVVPGYPPALEAIVLRALARDPDRRFSTALELQNQLEDYAHENRLRVSPLVLARLMSTLFPARLEEWDHARAQGAFFVEQHVVRTLIESGKTADSSPRFLPGAAPQADDGNGGMATDEEESEPTAIAVTPSESTQIGPEPRLTGPRPASSPEAGAPPRPASSPGAGAHRPPPSSRPSSPPMASVSPPGRPSSSPMASVAPPGRPSSPPMASVSPPGRPSSPSMASAVPPGRPSSPSMASASAGPRMSSPMASVSRPPPSPSGAGARSQPMVAVSPLPTPVPGTLSSASQSVPGMAPMPAQPLPTPVPGRAGQPLPTPVPGMVSMPPGVPPTPPPGALPSQAGGTPSGRYPSGRPAPVPNHPGAVPIVMAMPVPPIPSGGTLVSSATQAGNLPPAVRPVVGPHGGSGLDGLAGQNQVFTNPGGAAGYGAQGMQAGYAGAAPGEPGAVDPGVPGAYTNQVGDVTDRVRPAQARPTMQIRRQGSSKMAMLGVAIVGAAGLAVAALFVFGGNDTRSSSSTPDSPAAVRAPGGAPERSGEDRGAKVAAPAAPEPGSSNSGVESAGAVRAEPGAPGAEPARAPSTADQGANPPPARAAEPPGAEQPARAAEPPSAEPSARVAEPAPAAPSGAAGGAPEPGATDDDRVRGDPGKLVQQESHAKAPKPKRPDSKRGEKRPRKEQQWNADSPFLPDSAGSRH